MDARWESVLCPKNIKKIPSIPSAFNVMNRSNCRVESTYFDKYFYVEQFTHNENIGYPSQETKKWQENEAQESKRKLCRGSFFWSSENVSYLCLWSISGVWVDPFCGRFGGFFGCLWKIQLNVTQSLQERVFLNVHKNRTQVKTCDMCEQERSSVKVVLSNQSIIYHD
ncbi:S-adenosyl-L-methionine-dependentmethyltransferases superfamily protein [Striga asiatica]|uniref:S-adenosyl-L-methionine-dependentmethyltransferases superfamily protein n=1 Tax=Striga asiatica TaxID=4170 RepID=A0A5A7PAY1_STRAF|nr:S-adenosyl-L-methionine-dependentmethyltransferases superfamily protein [Striga asiatica]